MQYILKRFDELTLTELYEILRLRAEIFVVEQNSVNQDLDGKDYQAYHLIIIDNETLAGYLRILPENVAYEDVAIGRLVVKRQYRGKGLARKMIKKAIMFIINDLKKDKIRLSGQKYLHDFYLSLGFRRVSEEYLEDGIPHYEFLYEV